MMLAGSRASVRAKSLQEFRRLSPALLLFSLAGPEGMAGWNVGSSGDVLRSLLIGQVVC